MEDYTTIKKKWGLSLFFFFKLVFDLYDILFEKVRCRINSMYNYAILYLGREEEYENVYVFAYIKEY